MSAKHDAPEDLRDLHVRQVDTRHFDVLGIHERHDAKRTSPLSERTTSRKRPKNCPRFSKSFASAAAPPGDDSDALVESLATTELAFWRGATCSMDWTARAAAREASGENERVEGLGFSAYERCEGPCAADVRQRRH
eukprot:3939135-Pleurochrysis_carterae.AAC.2